MSLKKQKETQKDSVAQVDTTASTQEIHLDPSQVLYTLYDRVARDCNEAQKYLSITDIIGCLETVKLSIFQATHIAVAEKVQQEMQNDKGKVARRNFN